MNKTNIEKKITFFFCYAEDARVEVNQVTNSVLSLNDEWEGLYRIIVKDWHSFGTQSKTDGVQEVVYNDAIVKSDFAVFIINKQFGEKTIEEFHLVIERLKRRCLKPKICVYIKNNDYVNTNKIWFNDYSKYLTYLVFDNTIEIYEDIRKKIDQIIKRDMIIAIKSHNHYSSLRLQKLSTLFPNIYAEILTEQKTHKAFELIKIEELRHLNVDSLKSSPKLKISRTNKGIR